VEAVVSRGAVTIVERRPPWRPDDGPEWTSFGIARLRYNGQRGEWTLYWRDSNACWHRYDRIDPSSDLTMLLAEIESDPTAIFWG
jgi:hypothetical protein